MYLRMFLVGCQTQDKKNVARRDCEIACRPKQGQTPGNRRCAKKHSLMPAAPHYSTGRKRRSNQPKPKRSQADKSAKGFLARTRNHQRRLASILSGRLAVALAAYPGSRDGDEAISEWNFG